MDQKHISVLNKYGITLKQNPLGQKTMNSEGYLSTFISFWTSPENIDDIVSDIDRGLNGHYEEIEDPDINIHTFLYRNYPFRF